MDTQPGPSPSLAEWLVLCLICEEPAHGFAIARLLGSGGSIGQVWRVPKPVVYRALQRLEQLGLVQTTHQQSSSQGPVRSLVDATEAGRELASRRPANRPGGPRLAAASDRGGVVARAVS